MWSLRSGLATVRKLEGHLAPHYHVALAGGVVLRGKSDHDLDVIVYPHDSNHWHYHEIVGGLHAAGLGLLYGWRVLHSNWRVRGSADEKRVEVWVDDRSRRIDVIMPGAPL
jgi:hypothetical protein